MTLTTEAISWWHQNGEQLVPGLAEYSDEEINKNLRRAQKNAKNQEIINTAWEWLWQSDDGIDSKLMLTSWSKRSRTRNDITHRVPSAALANEIVDLDDDFKETRGRAKDLIEMGVDLDGMLLFDN